MPTSQTSFDHSSPSTTPTHAALPVVVNTGIVSAPQTETDPASPSSSSAPSPPPSPPHSPTDVPARPTLNEWLDQEPDAQLLAAHGLEADAMESEEEDDEEEVGGGHSSFMSSSGAYDSEDQAERREERYQLEIQHHKELNASIVVLAAEWIPLM